MVVTIAAFLAAPAIAADMRMPVKAPPPVATAVYNWTGFYLGGHAGYGWGRSKITDLDGYGFIGLAPAGTTFPFNSNGAIGGVQAGYNWQAGSLVFGVEFDFSFSGMRKNLPTPFNPAIHRGENFTADVNWFGTGRLRLGVPVDRALFYATGGLAYAEVENRFDDPNNGFFVAQEKVRWGWTAGGGIEYAFAPNWTMRGEYLFVDLKDTDPVPVTGLPIFRVKWEDHFHVARFGLNYRFGGPIVARY
jgi:outer membrane immunogenic protein